MSASTQKVAGTGVVIILGLIVAAAVLFVSTRSGDGMTCNVVEGPLTDRSARQAVERFAEAVATGDQGCVDRLTTAEFAAAQAQPLGATPDTWLEHDRALNRGKGPTSTITGSLAGRRQALPDASFSYQAPQAGSPGLLVICHVGAATYRVLVVSDGHRLLVDALSGTTGDIG